MFITVNLSLSVDKIYFTDVVWIEGPPSDSEVTAWSSLNYKIGDASGGFRKPVMTIECVCSVFLFLDYSSCRVT